MKRHTIESAGSAANVHYCTEYLRYFDKEKNMFELLSCKESLIKRSEGSSVVQCLTFKRISSMVREFFITHANYHSKCFKGA